MRISLVPTLNGKSGRPRTLVATLAAACLLGACGSRADDGGQSGRSSTARTTSSTAASASAPGARFLTGASRQLTVPADPHDAAAITRLVTAVFAHPEAAQCASAMTPRYVSTAFAADAARSGTSPGPECRAHQRLRARLPEAERRVTVQNIVMTGHDTHATVVGANGYPIGVTLARQGRTWRLDALGPAVVARGQGPEVAPVDSLYAYRVPPGFVRGGTAVGGVNTTGAAFSTSVVLTGHRSDDGVAIAQGAYGSGIHDRAALRAAIPRLDRAVRGTLIARVIGRPVAGEVGGHLALSWDLRGVGSDPAHTDGKSVIVFSSAANVVFVNCRWPQTGPDRSVLRGGCNDVLATLSVG